MLYTRRGLTAFRSYSSGDGGWSPEARVTNARLGKKQMGLTRNGVVCRGRLAYWLAKNVLFVLSLTSMKSAVVSFPWTGNGRKFDMDNTLLGVSPDGELRAVQFDRGSASIRVSTCSGRQWWDARESIPVEQSLPADVTSARLRWFCDKSGVVFFTATAEDGDSRRSEAYALSLDTRAVEMVASHGGDGDPWENIHGYEMDQTAYLASLAARDGMQIM